MSDSLEGQGSNYRSEITPPPETLEQHPAETIALGSLLLFKQIGLLEEAPEFWNTYEDSLRAVLRGGEIPPDQIDVFFRMEELVGAYTEYYANSVRAMYKIRPEGANGEIIQGLTQEEIELLDESKRFSPFSIDFGVKIYRDMAIFNALDRRMNNEKDTYPPEMNLRFQNRYWAEDSAISRATSQIEDSYKEFDSSLSGFAHTDRNTIRMFAELHALIASRGFELPISRPLQDGAKSTAIRELQPWENARVRMQGILYYRGFYGPERGEINLIQSSGNRESTLDSDSQSLVNYCLQLIRGNDKEAIPQELINHFSGLYGNEAYTPRLVPRRKDEGQSPWEGILRKEAEYIRSLETNDFSVHNEVGIQNDDDYDPGDSPYGNITQTSPATRGSRSGKGGAGGRGEQNSIKGLGDDRGGDDNIFESFVNGLK